MKKIILSAVAMFAMSSFATAGGDTTPIEEPVAVPALIVNDYTGAYIGVGYSFIDAPISNFNTFESGDWVLPSYDLDLSTDGFMINAGYRFNAYIAVEGRYWSGGNDNSDLKIRRDNIILDAGTVDIDLDAWGLYVKPIYSVTEVFEVYAMLGYGSATFDRTISYDRGTFSESLDVASFSWGFGIAYSFTENISVFADYIKVADEDLANPTQLPLGITDTKYEMKTYNIGVAYRF